MTLQTANSSLSSADAFNLIRSNAAGVKAQAQNALTTLQAGSVNSDFVFAMLNQFINIISALNTWKVVTGLDAYATAQGYTGTLSADCTATSNAATACISWVIANFPASGGFIQAYALNADGTRTPRSFTSSQTAGLQTNIQSFIATIG